MDMDWMFILSGSDVAKFYSDRIESHRNIENKIGNMQEKGFVACFI